MARGISLHVGVNRVSSAFPNAATLRGCENDAREMERIAIAKHFEPHDVLLGPDATYARVTTKIRSAAAQLEKGDFFFLSFAGHGFQRVDTRDDRDEGDRLDETILLFDVELFDDVFRKDLWPRFQPGVRVLMISDSCHSGSVFLQELGPTIGSRSPLTARADEEVPGGDEFPVHTRDGFRARTISNTTAFRHRTQQQQFYENTFVPLFSPPIRASVLLLAACEDFDRTADNFPNGIYTAAMLKVLRNSNPADYDALVKGIHDELRSAGRTQRPVIDTAGPEDSDFRRQKPFEI